MSDMIRRNKAVPVQARRVDPAPDTVEINGERPVPPQQPGVTQNIIYVNVPAGQPQAPPPQQPGEIHLHTHVHEYLDRKRGSRRGTSFLATLGFVLGGVACGTAYAPPLIWLAQYIAIAAGACAVLGLLGAILLRRTATFMPMLGLIVSGLAYWLWMIRSGQAKLALPRQFDVINNLVQPSAPSSTPAPPSTPTPQSDIVPTPSALPPKPTDHSIFGDKSPGWGKSSPAIINPPSTPPTISLPMDVATATSNLETARAVAARKLGIDYAGVKTTATDAKSEYEQIRQTASPGAPELLAASQAHLDADAKLLQVQQQLRADPAVFTAEQALKSAKAAAK